MAIRPLGAQISHMLKSRGVDVIFGIPGVHNVEMYRGIEEAGITHVLARHEQGAGFMADGFARATGRPGVAYVITGPGLCNIMTPMGQAYSDSVPMLVISSCLDETAAKRGQLHQMLDQRAAAATVCDWSEEARTADAAYALIDRALGEFRMCRARPKHIQVPIEVLGQPAPQYGDAVQSMMSPDQRNSNFSEAIGALAGARRLMVILGGGAHEAAAEIRLFLKNMKAASFCTYAGRGIAAPDDALHFGSYLGRPESASVIGSADVVLAIGTELAEVDLWRGHLGHTGTLIRIDRDPAVLTVLKKADIAVLAEARMAMATLIDAMEPETGARGGAGWTADEVAAARARWRAETDAERPGIVPICDALRAVLPADTMIFSDMTQFAYVAKEVWPMDRPGHWHHPYGFGTLGYALPAAIGGKVGLPDGPVVAIAGDYGFQYTLQELGVAVELGLSLPILLWDNGKLKEIEDSMVRSQIAPNAVVARNPDFCKLAEAYGAASARPATLADLQAEVEAALARKGPTLIHMTPELKAFRD